MQIKGTFQSFSQTTYGKENKTMGTLVLSIQDGAYSNPLAIKLFKDDLLKSAETFSVGMEVTAEISFKSREVDGQKGKFWSTDVSAWKLVADLPKATAVPIPSAPVAAPSVADAEPDDLPF